MVLLFISYSHIDEFYRNELEKHLSILKRNGIIDAWHDRRILAGSEFDEEISDYLKQADIILLLISSDFLASDYCYEKEMKFALQMHENKQAVVIPIILRSCDWKETPFGKLSAIPKDSKPVSKYPMLDDAFLEIVQEIKRVIEAKFPEKQQHSESQTQSVINTIFPTPRSSNLRITKEFSDHDKDKFLDDAFEYISKYFENSLLELQNRNSEVTYRFKKMDAQAFATNIYVNGKAKCECMIYYGKDSPFSNGINFSHQISTTRNILNESLNVKDNGYSLYLTTMGMSSWGRNDEKELTFEGGAEYFWQLLIRPLQSYN